LPPQVGLEPPIYIDDHRTAFNWRRQGGVSCAGIVPGISELRRPGTWFLSAKSAPSRHQKASRPFLVGPLTSVWEAHRTPRRLMAGSPDRDGVPFASGTLDGHCPTCACEEHILTSGWILQESCLAGPITIFLCRSRRDSHQRIVQVPQLQPRSPRDGEAQTLQANSDRRAFTGDADEIGHFLGKLWLQLESASRISPTCNRWKNGRLRF